MCAIKISGNCTVYRVDLVIYDLYLKKIKAMLILVERLELGHGGLI